MVKIIVRRIEITQEEVEVEVPQGYFLKTLMCNDSGDFLVFQESKRAEKEDTFTEDQYKIVCRCIQENGVVSKKNPLVVRALEGLECTQEEKRKLVRGHKRFCKASPRCV